VALEAADVGAASSPTAALGPAIDPRAIADAAANVVMLSGVPFQVVLRRPALQLTRTFTVRTRHCEDRRVAGLVRAILSL
jgi:hypothetical protein